MKTFMSFTRSPCLVRMTRGSRVIITRLIGYENLTCIVDMTTNITKKIIKDNKNREIFLLLTSFIGERFLLCHSGRIMKWQI